jgi:hypothetical protein
MGQTTAFVNNVFYYPARDINYDATEEPGAERGPIIAVSNPTAATEMKIPVTVRMSLTTDCDLLKEFHRRIGTKFGAWVNTANVDGNDNIVRYEGWNAALNYLVGQPLQNKLTQVAQRYPWQQIWNDAAVKAKFQQELNDELPEAIKRQTKQVGPDGVVSEPEFFNSIQVTVLPPKPLNEKLTKSLSDQQAEVTASANAKITADTKVAQAQSETKLALEEAKKHQADIAGYGGVDGYLKQQIIDKGGNPYQPGQIPLPVTNK